MVATIDGPRIAPKSTPRQLVVFLHGYGADGNDLIELGRQWRAFMPDALFVAPHAPELCAMAPSGRQWFSLTMRDPAERWTGVNKARPTLDAFLDAELTKLGLDESALALVGFSQGTMMALQVAPRRPAAFAGIVGFSGRLLHPERLGAEIVSRPPVLLVHGDADPMVPVASLSEAAAALTAAGVETRTHVSKGVGHGIAPDGLGLALDFIRGRLDATAGRPS